MKMTRVTPAKVIYVAFGVFIAAQVIAKGWNIPWLGYFGVLAYVTVFGAALFVVVWRNMLNEISRGVSVRALGVVFFGSGIVIAFASALMKFFSGSRISALGSFNVMALAVFFILTGLLLVVAEAGALAIRRNLTRRRLFWGISQGVVLLSVCLVLGYFLFVFASLLA